MDSGKEDLHGHGDVLLAGNPGILTYRTPAAGDEIIPALMITVKKGLGEL